MPSLAARSTSRFASRLALVVSAALSLGACEDVTAPIERTANDAAPSAAVVRSTSGQTGTVATPYPSVQCWGPAASDYRVSVLGATVYPAQMMSASERVTQQVYLYKWAGTRWSDAIASRTATRTAFPAAMPTATFSYLTQGHYKIVTRFTWQVYTSSGWTTTGTKVVDYNQASDYKGSFAAVAQAGYCTL